MPKTVTCPCGKDFVIVGNVYPRTVSCHECGARTVLTAPSFSTCKDWQIGEKQMQQTEETSYLQPGGVRCSVCGGYALAACARCGRFYCVAHGRARLNGPSTC